jgi:hypothetical protein
MTLDRSRSGTRSRGTLATRMALVGSVGLAAALVGFVPSSAAPARPDLVITSIEVHGIGSPPHIEIGHSGIGPTVTVKVVTTNDGNVAAGKSTTAVDLFEGTRLVARENAHVGRLGRHDSEPSTVTFHGVQFDLGFTRVIAFANDKHTVKESDKDNELEGPRIAVAARRWDVSKMTVKETARANFTSTTEAVDFHFQFKKFDESSKSFDYEAIGEVKGHTAVTGTCSGSGGSEKTKNPWPHSSLSIDWSLDRYDALVESSRVPKYSVKITCLGGLKAPPRDFALDDLDTNNGTKYRPAMTPKQDNLSGEGKEGTVDLKTNWEWSLKADVP